MKQFISGMLFALLAAVIYACTTPSSGGSGAGNVLFKVNGRGVTAEEFFANRQARDAVQQYVMLESMKDEARKVGAKVDEKQFTEETEEIKDQIKLQNQSWEEFLKNQGTTEQEFLEQRRTMALFQALLKKKANVTEEEMKTAWETDKDSLINDYAAKNGLADSEKAKVTFEQVKDLARERVEMNKMGIIQNEVMSSIILDSKLEFVAVADAKKAKDLADRVMGPAREQAEEQAKAAAEQKAAEQAAAGGDAAEDGAAAEGEDDSDAPAEGEAADAPAEGEGEGEEGADASAEGEAPAEEETTE